MVREPPALLTMAPGPAPRGRTLCMSDVLVWCHEALSNAEWFLDRSRRVPADLQHARGCLFYVATANLNMLVKQWSFRVWPLDSDPRDIAVRADLAISLYDAVASARTLFPDSTVALRQAVETTDRMLTEAGISARTVEEWVPGQKLQDSRGVR